MEDVKEIKFKQTIGGMKLPRYDNEKTAVFNIFSGVEELISPSQSKKIRTGTSFEVPEGYALLVVPNSDMSEKTPLRFANSVSVVEHGNTEELVLNVENPLVKEKSPRLVASYRLTTGEEVEEDFKYGYIPVNSVLIKKNDCIARGILIKTERIKLSRVSKKDGE